MGANPKAEWLQSHFLPYQLAWIYDDSDVAMAIKGRQLGFSDGTAGAIVDRGFYRRRPQVFLSASQKIADELIVTTRTHCEILAALGCKAATDFTVNNTEELAWRTGGRVLALSSSDRTGRSYHGDIWFDEFAFHEDPEKIWRAAAPMATRAGWKLRVISTPNGSQGLFYQWAKVKTPDGWSVHRVSLTDAERDGLVVDRARLLQLVGGDERVFGEAYELDFLDANLQYIPSALVERATQWPGLLPDLSGATWHAGLDVGRTKDVTALAIIAVVGRVAWVVTVLTCSRTNFRAQRKLVRDARAAFGWETLHVDQTGIGRDMAEELVEWWGEDEVKLVSFTEQSKEDLCTRTLRWHKNSRVRYPRGEMGATLAAQAISLRRVVTDKNHVTYTFPRGPNGHGDEFTALMLALKGAGEPPTVRGMGEEPLLNVA